MDDLGQDAYFWRLIHHLVVNENMVALKVKSNEKEVWLEKEGVNETTIVRLFRRNLDWTNYITRDIEKLAQHGEKVRKQLRARRINIINVYISNFLPVDSYDQTLNKTYVTKNKRLKINSYIIDGEFRNTFGIRNLNETLECKLPTIDDKEGTNPDKIHFYRNEVKTISEKKIEEERSIFTYGKPLFTYLILINILIIFALMEYLGSSTSLLTLIEFGAKFNPLIREGEWWRFFTSIFLHIGFLHFFMNSLALYYLGSAVERIYGTQRFVFIYVLAGIFGSISSFAFNSQVAAGASGAIFGCFGALLYFGVIHRKLFFRTMGVNVIVILIINLALGFTIPMIDNGAHIGGLIGGFLASAFLQLPKQKRSIQQVFSLLVTALSITGLLFYGFSTEEEAEKLQLINVQISQELLQQDEVEKAYWLLKEVASEDVSMTEVYFLLAYSEARLGLLKDAETNLLITLEKRPLFHEAHYNLSLVYYELRQYVDALRSVEKAIELNPEKEDYYDLKRIIQRRLAEI